jgi:DNA-binding transcriptional MerR regulator
MRYTVKQLADLAGVSVRTLHYYDQIGLLTPSAVGQNGYRYYGEDAVLRLQQVMFYRELDFPLAKIQAILNEPEFDLLVALQSHKRLLQQRLGRLSDLIQTIDRTVLHLKGARKVETHDLFEGFVDLPFLGPKSQGKVRDIYDRGDHLILVTTDRLSAFDRILGLVPYKGQTLNQLSAFWFEQTADILPNHLLELPDPNVAVVRTCTPLPVEVVVRGYISGVTSTALWYRYSQSERNIYGIDFPDGLHKNDLLPTPVITPTTKARDGGHDERITSAEVVSSGLVEAKLWDEVKEAAVAIFLRGQEVAQRPAALDVRLAALN